ncbi:MAG: APC family permease [Planctomycetota bacterium]|nr:APC family permease [Planctomycetota bacterium]
MERQVGIWGAVMMGLGSIVGTGVFVSIGVGFSVAGVLVLPAILVAAGVATLNGLSSAQLAANHPVSGGTYAYGYRWLTPSLGFSAGILFLVAKSASAATAALGCSGYLLELTGFESEVARVVLPLLLVLAVTGLVAGGMKRSNGMNIGIVSLTLACLLALIVTGILAGLHGNVFQQLKWSGDGAMVSSIHFLECCALMFVAFTGYGRIATLGEEITMPEKNIPRAIILTLVISGLLYTLIGLVVVVAGVLSPEIGAGQWLSLKAVAESFNVSWVVAGIAVGAVTAMLGVLLNLVMGLSRVWFAMGREGDLPAFLGKVNSGSSSPTNSVVVTGVWIAALTLIGDVKMTWSLSAFTVLVYYAITNLAATRLSAEERCFPKILAWLGFAACLSLAFFVSPRMLIAGTAILVAANALRGLWVQRSR